MMHSTYIVDYVQHGTALVPVRSQTYITFSLPIDLCLQVFETERGMNYLNAGGLLREVS